MASLRRYRIRLITPSSLFLTNMTTVAAIIPAGGSGCRMGTDLPKQFLEVAGMPVLVHTVKAVQRASSIKTIIIAVPADHVDQVWELVDRYDLSLVAKVVAGGLTRQDSVLAGLAVLPDDTDLVVVHDGVRPLIGPDLVEACVQKAAQTGAAMAAVPVKDTLKMAKDGVVATTVDRRGLWQAQTPQVAGLETMRRAFDSAAADGFQGTDEAALLERIGVEVSLVMGSDKNIKITRPEDLELAEAFLGKGLSGGVSMGALRVGHGYDAHQLVEGRVLVLGGVTIPNDRGLSGHSDADVLLHALCDAILGAAGLGDIGRHFPDSDPAYRGISSLILLAEVVKKTSKAGFRLVNADVTVVAQEPRLVPHFDQMTENISRSVGVDVSCLNLKATTTEQMGFVGRGEGIAAHAVVLLASSQE
jgi:2-C-methyl-D-erythritol 4-phosphate cytidylyltransferase/2-C-methyl-D-erythritol 2,4-cyclodiphosphate synthase